MAFEWLQDFYRDTLKSDDYAAKTLAAYRLGIKAGGSLRGVRIEVDDSSCGAANALPQDAVFQPDEAPHLPLPDCPLGHTCRCVYRPVMVYERPE